MCKPFLKWVGGKRQLINDIKKYMPKKFNRYFEPFVGGGALFFELKINDSIINDYNNELTNLYNVIKNSPLELIEDVKKHKINSDYYYNIRSLDRDEKLYDNLSDIEKASRFIYLNKTGYNGLYRVNQKGQNNVPFGKYKSPKILEEKNIIECSKLLKNTKIMTGDFENIKSLIKEKDFVYLDPPYVPLNTTSSFTAYTDKGFDDDMQFRLKELCDYINEMGAYFMMSNSYTDFILELYKDYKINTVEANRALNCKATGRGKIKEVLVTNY